MSSTINDVRVATGDSAEAKREGFKEGAKERARRASEIAEQREERLCRRRIIGVQPSQSNKDKHFFNLGGKG